MKSYDVIIIGAGVGGLSAAKNLLDSGLKVLLVEKNKVGGKTIHGGGAFVNHVFQALKFKHRIDQKEIWSIKGDSSNIIVDKKEIIQNYNRAKTELIKRYSANIFASDIDFIQGEASLVDSNHVQIKDEIYEARSIILATGAKYRRPPFLGLEQALANDFVIEPTEIGAKERNPHHILVLGEGRIAYESVELMARLGIHITFVLRKKYFLKHIDADVRELMYQNLQSLNVEVIDDYDDVSFEAKTVKVIKADQTKVFKPDYCILAMGYIKDDSMLGNLTFECVKDGLITNEFCQTSIENIYAIGDANHRLKLSNVAMSEGQIAANHILGKQETGIEYKDFISGIMGVYEYAQLGLTEEEIIEKGIPYYVYHLNTDFLLDTTFTQPPLLKIYMSKITHDLLGIHLFGENGNDQLLSLLSILKTNSSYRMMHLPVQPRLQKIKDEISTIHNHLIHDLIEGSLQFVYQAVLDNQTHQVLGYESLSRFYIDGKLMQTLPIIMMLEERGKIAHLDLKSIEQAGITLQQLKENGIDITPLSIFINISSNTIISENVEHIYQAAIKNQCPPEKIVLEVTERQVVNNPRVLKSLEKLRKYGFRIALDDFSMGHASLSILAKFQFDEIKLDASLLPLNRHDQIKLQSYRDLVDLIRLYKVKIVAEGIEDDFQASYVQTLAIDYVQGYHFHRPAPVVDDKNTNKKE